jgi:hypothetical protein
MKKALLASAIGGIALLAFAGAGEAAEQRAKVTATEGSLQPAKARYNRKRHVRVRGYLGRRVGGYSYAGQDVVNTYGLSRSLYGSINSYRDPFVDRQTPSGPFDHDFFFDSGIAPRGGDSPYMR